MISWHVEGRHNTSNLDIKIQLCLVILISRYVFHLAIKQLQVYCKMTRRMELGTHRQVLFLAMLDDLLLTPCKQVEAYRQQTLETCHHQWWGKLFLLVGFLGSCALLLFLKWKTSWYFSLPAKNVTGVATLAHLHPDLPTYTCVVSSPCLTGLSALSRNELTVSVIWTYDVKTLQSNSKMSPWWIPC